MKKRFDTFRKVPFKRHLNYVLVVGIMLIFGILAAAGGLKSSGSIMLEKIAISIILAVSLSLVVGFLGELSLGHAGFMCIGAYLGGMTAKLLSPVLGNGLLTFLLALLVGTLCAGVFGFIIGLPALRLKGDYLAIVTLAFGEIVKVLFQQSDFFGGNLGLTTPKYGNGILSKKYFFLVAFLMVLLTLAVVQNLMRSKHGRAITAIRDNEIAARATGIDVTKYKLLAFIVSACLAGIAGVLFNYTNSTVQAEKFGYNYSIEILVMVVLGGMGNINGTLLSAVLITFLNIKLQTVLTGELAVLKDILYALILVLIVIYNNSPMLKNFREKYNLRKLFDKLHRHDNPALIKDDAAKWDVIPTKIPMDEVLSVDLTAQTEYTPDKPKKGGSDHE